MNKWLKDAIIYQVYPLTFCDANGDGIGDLAGVESKLDYIKDLGADVIWLNPIYPSTFTDGGYDVTEFCDVDPRFGTLEDFDSLVAACKKRGLRLVLDFVPGHTSYKHPWFEKSATFEPNEYWDRYIWTDSVFNKYADKSIHGFYDRDGGYVVNYYATQPALNYGFNRLTDRAPESPYDCGDKWKMHYTDPRLKPLREEMIAALKFWLDRGIDGFRMDCANSLVKECLPNSPRDEDLEGLLWVWKEIFAALRPAYPDAMFIAEWICPENSVGKAGFDLDYFGHDMPWYNALFRNTPGSNILRGLERGENYFSEKGAGSVSEFLRYCESLWTKLDGKGYFSVPSGYHDVIRLAKNKTESELKTAFAFLLTFKHVPLVYYGDEIGMTQRENVNRDGGYVRTGARTPMQWTDGKNRGFSSAPEKDLYLPVNGNAGESVESQKARPDSLYNLVKRLTALRKAHAALRADGGIRILAEGYPLCYERFDGEERFLVCVNPSAESRPIVGAYSEIVYAEHFDEKNRELSGGGILIAR